MPRQQRSGLAQGVSFFLKNSLLLIFALILSSCGASDADIDDSTSSVEQVPATPFLTELDQLQAQLGELEQRALQDPSVIAARTRMVNSVREAGDEDPAMEAMVQEMNQVVAESNAARERGDTATANQLDSHYTVLSSELTAMRGAVAERPEVAPHVEEYNSSLLRKMIELDPTAEPSIRRLFALRDSL